jgi:hypothetical protein
LPGFLARDKIFHNRMKVSCLIGSFLLLGLSPLTAQTAEQIERMLEESGEQHMREELGVNPITAPAIRNLLHDLDQYRPIPLDIIAMNRRDLTFPNRLQTALHFGSMVADGFMLTLAERPQDIEDIGRALIRQANNLGVGDRLTRRSKSLLEKSSRGDWIGMREELIATQGDVEDAMMELRDEEIAHLVSLGGWMRGFQLAANATAENYFPTRAEGLVNDEVMEYFLERLSTLHPRMRSTELVTTLTNKLGAIREIGREANGRAPTREEVIQMRDLANELFLVTVSPVNEEGKISGPPMVNTP